MTGHKGANWLVAVGLLLGLLSPVWGQGRAALAGSSDDAVEAAPILNDAAPVKGGKSSAIAAPSPAMDVSRVLLALVAVIGLIFVLRLFARRFVPGSVGGRASSAVKVLARCPLAGRQNLLVVQFGRRLVLVGDAGTSLNPLCEISDPDEVAAVVTQTREEAISVARRFESLFGRSQKDFRDSAGHGESFDSSHEVSGENSSGEDRSIAYRAVEYRAGEYPAGEYPAGENSVTENTAVENPVLEETQRELCDLREKVRDVARQIGHA